MLFRIIFVLLHKTIPSSITYDYSHPVQRIHLAEQIVLRAFGREKYYLRDLPLHHTQKELKPRTAEVRQQQEAQDFSDFEYHLRPTADFKGQIMSRGAWLKVLQPEWLAHEIRQWHEDAIKRYQEK